jgi:hypothetical protein
MHIISELKLAGLINEEKINSLFSWASFLEKGQAMASPVGRAWCLMAPNLQIVSHVLLSMF